jgi:hypothetical protein
MTARWCHALFLYAVVSWNAQIHGYKSINEVLTICRIRRDSVGYMLCSWIVDFIGRNGVTIYQETSGDSNVQNNRIARHLSTVAAMKNVA